VEVVSIAHEVPYRKIRVRALSSTAGASAAENEVLRAELARLISVKLRLARAGGKEMAAFLRTVDDPEIFSDIAAFSVCEDARVKQRLLETLDLHRRLTLFRTHLQREIAAMKLQRTLQGRITDEQIGGN